MDFLKKLLYNDVPEAEQPLRQERVAPLVTNETQAQPIMFQDSGSNAGNIFAAPTQTPVISDEEKQKWQNYFSKLYSETRSINKEYDQFLTNIDTVTETDPTLPDANRFRFAFNFTKKAGITKEALIASANAASQAVEHDRDAVFDKDIQKKNAAIEGNNKLILDKRNQIQTLMDEIKQLESDNQSTKEKIAVRTTCYNTFSAHLLAKIKNDIAGIMNFLI